jgi:hypothetical protein
MTQSVASTIAAERIALPVAERERAAKATAARISNKGFPRHLGVAVHVSVLAFHC